jgi:capsular exopolysaccharide synthesis family protein
MENNYGLLLSNTEQGAINTLTIIETAKLPTNPIGPMKGLTILLAAMVGFALAAGEAYLLEYLDDSLKSPDSVVRVFSAPIIGHVFEQGGEKDEEVRIFTADDLGRPISEAFRSLRTNLEMSQADRPLKTILVTSADIGDGKTSVAANLALSMAQRDKEVVLLDADLRKPNVHGFFELTNDQGLADLISERASLNDVLHFKKDRKVAVLTAGNTPPNPTELLSSKNMDQLLRQLRETADVVIIDGPPFIVADAMILASKVDGVLLVVRPGHTRQSLAKASVEHIKLVGARVVGVVLNRIPLRGADYYAGKSYRDTYYVSTYGDERASKNAYLEKLKEILSPYSSKLSNIVKHLRSRSRLSPK